MWKRRVLEAGKAATVAINSALGMLCRPPETRHVAQINDRRPDKRTTVQAARLRSGHLGFWADPSRKHHQRSHPTGTLRYG